MVKRLLEGWATELEDIQELYDTALEYKNLEILQLLVEAGAGPASDD